MLNLASFESVRPDFHSMMSRTQLLLCTIATLLLVCANALQQRQHQPIQYASQLLSANFSVTASMEYWQGSPCWSSFLWSFVTPGEEEVETIYMRCEGTMNLRQYALYASDKKMSPRSNQTTIVITHQITPACFSTLDQKGLTSKPVSLKEPTEWPSITSYCNDGISGFVNGVATYQWQTLSYTYCPLDGLVHCNGRCYEAGTICCGGKICLGNRCCGPNQCCNNSSTEASIFYKKPITVVL